MMKPDGIIQQKHNIPSLTVPTVVLFINIPELQRASSLNMTNYILRELPVPSSLDTLTSTPSGLQ